MSSISIYNHDYFLFPAILILVVLFLYFYNKPRLCKVYLINLKERKKRLKTTLRNLNNLGYPKIQRFEAVNGHLMSNQEIMDIVDEKALTSIWNNKRKYDHELSRGAVGCYLSHVAIWEKLQNDKNQQFYLILEDDTMPTKTLEQIHNTLKRLPPDWDIYLCGGIYERSNVVKKNICKVSQFMCTHAYVIHRKKLPIILSNVYPIRKQIDFYLSELSMQNVINIYGSTNHSWIQNQEIAHTDIQTPLISS